jgi:hypothetical protein
MFYSEYRYCFTDGVYLSKRKNFILMVFKLKDDTYRYLQGYDVN